MEWAFTNHLKINGHTPPSSYLFGLKSELSTFLPMCKSIFMSRCNEKWSSLHLNSLGIHSFHIGGTTQLLLIGMDPFNVMVQGRWKSMAFLEYWKNCKEIIPTCISLSLSSNSSVLTSMSAFKQCIINSI